MAGLPTTTLRLWTLTLRTCRLDCGSTAQSVTLSSRVCSAEELTSWSASMSRINSCRYSSVDSFSCQPHHTVSHTQRHYSIRLDCGSRDQSLYSADELSSWSASMSRINSCRYSSVDSFSCQPHHTVAHTQRQCYSIRLDCGSRDQSVYTESAWC